MMGMLVGWATAQARVPASVDVCAVDGVVGAPVLTALVRFAAAPRDRWVVDAGSGCVSVTAVYADDGSEQVVTPGAQLAGWVVAPGYAPAALEVVSERRRTVVEVALTRLEPVGPEATELARTTTTAFDAWAAAAATYAATPSADTARSYADARNRVASLALDWLAEVNATSAPRDAAVAVCRTAVDRLDRCE